MVFASLNPTCIVVHFLYCLCVFVSVSVHMCCDSRVTAGDSNGDVRGITELLTLTVFQSDRHTPHPIVSLDTHIGGVLDEHHPHSWIPFAGPLSLLMVLSRIRVCLGNARLTEQCASIYLGMCLCICGAYLSEKLLFPLTIILMFPK